MKDLIYRQDAIDAVEKESQVDGAYGYMDTRSIVDLLSDLPSAQQWTPVSEGLPKDLEVVNITYINTEPTTYYDHIKGKPMVATAVYYRKRFYWYSVTCVDVLGEYGTDEWDEMDDRIEVKAWMPLPEPYRGGDA